MFVEAVDSTHKGVRGMAKITTAQQAIKQQLDSAQKRADTLLKLVAKGE